jgi:replication-associated recombination protein RarA
MSNHPLLSDLLQPTELDHLALPARDIARLRAMISERVIMNMVFHGPSGAGKSS